MLPEWKAFLQDQEVADVKTSPRGQYLYGKILHDLLQYLNAYRDYIELVFTYGEQSVPESTLKWIRSHESSVQQMVEGVSGFWCYHQDLEAYGDQWPELIQQAGSQIDGMPELILELKQLPVPNEGDTRAWMEAGIQSLERAERMRQAIYAQEYKKLYLTKHW